MGMHILSMYIILSLYTTPLPLTFRDVIETADNNVCVFYVLVSSCILQNPGVSDVYIEHSVQATVAQYAPSGYYIASGGEHTADTCTKIVHWLVCK